MSEEKSSGKSKLTLSVEKDVIEKAKKLGLNLSETVENVLEKFTFRPDTTDKESVYSGYKSMFELMLPLLKEYETKVLVAEWLESTDDTFENVYENAVTLLEGGTLYEVNFERPLENIHEIPIFGFLKPVGILYNFINALSDAKERRQEKLEEIELAKRLLSAILNSTDKITKG